jgi:signal peptidase II
MKSTNPAESSTPTSNGPPQRDARGALLLISLLVIVIDRCTKLWVDRNIPLDGGILVIPHFFRLSHVLNTGAAFSIFADSLTPATVRGGLIAFSVLAACIVFFLLWKVGRIFTLTSFSLALILGGAIGNLYDRVALGHVIDFLEVHIETYHWPDFNVADSAISVGACLLLIEIFRAQPDPVELNTVTSESEDRREEQPLP